LRCPFCGHEDSQVKDSRPTDDGAAIRRRRQCEACAARFTTFERIQLRDIWVLKSEGRRQAFDRDKLARSIDIACRKRQIDPARIEKLVSGIQRQIETAGDGEVSATQIGQLVMEGLRQLDSVAYIRFASVYKDFNEASDFEDFAGTVKEAADSKELGVKETGSE
jgi:transcriptional repressor NrdR